MARKLLKLNEVCEEYGIPRSTAYRVWRTWPHIILSKHPRFPSDEIKWHFTNAARIAADKPKARPGQVIIQRSYARTA